MSRKRLLFLGLFALLLPWGFLGCCACDCPSSTFFIIEFYDKTDGSEYSISASCGNGQGNVVNMVPQNHSGAVFQYYNCGNFISLDARTEHLLCELEPLIVQLSHEGELVETFEINYRNTADKCCGCSDACYFFDDVSLEDSLNYYEDGKIYIFL